MKKLTVIFLTFLLALTFIIGLPKLSLAQTDEHPETINEVIEDILSSQNLKEISKIDCNQITDNQLEKLGDAYMEQMHPGPRHEYLDQMMGGEGSVALRTAHIQMGRAYLGCGTGWGGMGAMGGFKMMGTGMMGDGGPAVGSGLGKGVMDRNYFGAGMMGSMFGWYNLAGAITMLLLWTLLILGIVALSKWIKKS